MNHLSMQRAQSKAQSTPQAPARVLFFDALAFLLASLAIAAAKSGLLQGIPL